MDLKDLVVMQHLSCHLNQHCSQYILNLGLMAINPATAMCKAFYTVFYTDQILYATVSIHSELFWVFKLTQQPLLPYLMKLTV